MSSVSTEMWFKRSVSGARSGNTSMYWRSFTLKNVMENDPSGLLSEKGSPSPNMPR